MTSQTIETLLLPLEMLRADEEFQPRYGGLVKSHVNVLMHSDPSTWPPLLVRPNDLGGYDLIDGFHRYEAAFRLGLPSLPCRVDPEGDYPDGVLANINHGLPLKLQDRKIAATYWAEVDPSLSYREIGRRTGLNHETAKRAIENPEPPGEGHERRKPDPIEKLVAQVYRAYSGGHGRNWLGFGHDGNAKPFKHAIEAYDDEDRETIAEAVLAFGHACVAAAQPFLSER